MDLVVKSDKEGRRIIQGIASTDDTDLQGEVVIQKGIDYSYFMRHGFLNDDHKEGPEHKVGEPLECRITPAGFWIKAMLYKGKERADFWWEHITALKNNDSSRKVGFSIQGKVLRREGKTIHKCWLQDVAITASPVNTSTWAEISKSLNSEKWCVHPWDDTCVGGCCSCSKSLEAVDADKEDEEKALSAGGMGAMLVPESLEGSVKEQTYKSDRLSYADAIKFLQEDRKYSLYTAKALADAIFVTHGIH